MEGTLGETVKRANATRTTNVSWAKNYTDNVEAYQLYLKGRYYLARLRRAPKIIADATITFGDETTTATDPFIRLPNDI